MKKYKMIQLEETAYLKLKEFCKENDKKMGPLIARWINDTIKDDNPPRNVLRVNT